MLEYLITGAGLGQIFRVRVAMHPYILVNLIMTIPGDMVVIFPVVGLILATAGLLVDHVPGTPVCSINVPVSPMHIIEGPVITGADTVMVTIVVPTHEQLLVAVYVMVVVPVSLPARITAVEYAPPAFVMETDAIAGLAEVQLTV